MAEVRLLPAAEQDAAEALEWYLTRSAATAARFEASLAEAIERVGNFPEAFTLIDDEHRQCLLRRFPYGLIYRVLPDGSVLVVAVAHTSRAAEFWQSRG